MSEPDTLAERVKALEGDLAAAAGELRIPAPTPGTDMARMVAANVIMRRERDEARSRLAKLASRLSARCVALERELSALRQMEDEARRTLP